MGLTPDRVELNHRRILAGLYLLSRPYLAAEVAVPYRDTIDGLRQFFEGDSDVYACAAAAIVFSAPISCLALAYLVNAGSRNLVIFLLATHTSIVFPYGLLIAIYLLWWYVSENRSRAA